jgi:hypothetical protein
MRRTHRGATAVISAAAGLGLALAGCADGTTPGSSPSAGPTSGPASPGGAVAACVAGTWRSTTLSADAGSNQLNADLTGGSGITVRIGTTGATTLDFTGMEPVTFSAKVAGADVRGRFTYAGTATGTITTGAASGNASTATAGTWAPVGDLNWKDTRLTVDLTEPLQARPFDNTPIGNYVGEGTGNAVDIDPFFDRGSYRCSGDTLTLAPDDKGDIPWTLKRTAS